ncbi:hypothetical protein BCR33DRAFT_713241, partial [Rhizoclosmatium globosum]
MSTLDGQTINLPYGDPPPYPAASDSGSDAVLLAEQLPIPVQNCRHSWGEPYFSVSAYVVGILCFPCGLLCCFRMKDKKCSKCGEVVDADYVERQGDDHAYRMGLQLEHGKLHKQMGT